MGFFMLNNLSSSTIRSGEPWKDKVEIPEAVRRDKAKFIEWCQKPTTKGCHYALVEGMDPLRRVSEDNPAVLIHGVVADYDAPCSQEMLDNLIENCPIEFVPMYACLTFSGGARLVWLFETPVTLSSYKVTKSLMKYLAKKMKLGKFLPGFDVDAFYDPHRYYERGRDWVQLSSTTIPTNIVHQWCYEAGNRLKWKDLTGINIPLDDVYAEIQKKFPGQWQGPFEPGARGRRFWDESSDNITAAVVRDNGMQCFTGLEGFVPWAQILGSKFVEKYEADRTGAIITDMFYDGKNYWHVDHKGSWYPVCKDDLRLKLKVKYALSSLASRNETSSEVDKILYAIQDQKTVTAAMPFVHFPPGILVRDNVRYLNTSSARCIEPAEESQEWGEGFPFLAEFIGNFFNPADSLDYFLAWLQHAYAGYLKQDPTMGQAIFIAGDPNVGKTLMSTGVVSRLLGGHTDASAYLLGEEKFTSHVVSRPVMTVDDTAPATDLKRHTRYSAMIKKITANRHQHFEEKFLKAGQVEWLGRIIVTCNLDPESIKLLPNMDISINDKVMIFCAARSKVEFPDSSEMTAILDRELPYFARWLLDWTPPAHVKGDSRYRVKSYLHKHLHNEAIQTSASYSFLELLADHLNSYQTLFPAKSAWEGTSTDLLADMCEDERIGSLASKYTPLQVASLLGQIKSRGFALERLRTSKQRRWKIPLDVIEGHDDGQAED